MPRQLRLEYEGAVYHVMARGNRRESIYRDDRDRLAWLDYLSQASSRREKGVVFWEPGVRERLLALLPRTDADVRTDQGQHYEAAVLMKDAAEEKAERIFIRELRAAGLAEKALRERPRSEPLKWKIARIMRTETAVSLGWIARRLDLGSASNVCHKMRRDSIFKS